jgi:hypothetical protein
LIRLIRTVRSVRWNKIESCQRCNGFYGVIVSPGTKQFYVLNAVVPRRIFTTRAEIRGAQSSPQVIDAKAFAGCWNNMTFCLWGRGVELLVDATRPALNNQVRIFANLLCDVGVRYPGAFAVTAAVT